MSELEIEIVDDNAEIEIDAVDSDVELQFEIDATSGGTDDYEKLNNLPKINGTTLKGNYNEIDPTVPAWAKADTKPTYTAEEVGALPDDTVIPEVPTNVSAFVNDSGYLTEETDPTVPQWAKASSKPTYSASEVGALPSDTFIPSKVSDLTNDSGFITTESDPTVPSWAKQETKPSYTAEEVGALPNTTQIPSKVSDLTNDSDFQTATEVSQTVADAVGQITSFDYAIVNELPASGVKGTIYLVHKADEEEQNVYAEYLWINNAWESIGDTKVDMSDYTKTEDLAAVALSNKSSDLTNDAGFITSETDPTVPSWAKQSEKPSYTASEVGALPDTTIVPSADGVTIVQSASGVLTAIGGGSEEVYVGNTAPTDEGIEIWVDTSVQSATFQELPFRFGIDSSGNYGYIKNGETTVTPFGSGGTSIAGRTTVFDSETISLSNLEVE